jgi:phage head maturation protease
MLQMTSNRSALATRVISGMEPSTYDPESRTVDAVLSRGSAVQRFYGTEKLEISRRAINLSRMTSSIVPVLDSHNQGSINSALGRLVRAWLETDDDGPALMGRMSFNSTQEGLKAEAMVARGEISAISIGYQTTDWEIRDKKGNVVDPDSNRWADDDLTFIATEWTLVEASLVSIPADASAVMRHDQAYSAMSPHARRALARMRMRQAAASTNTIAVAPPVIARPDSIFGQQQRQEANALGQRLIFYGPPK